MASIIYFGVLNGSNADLWSYGAGAAQRVRTINADGRNVGSLMAINQKLYFTGDTAAAGYELWTSDGTSDGTVTVREILAGSGGSNPGPFANFGGRLLFSATNTSGAERPLWIDLRRN